MTDVRNPQVPDADGPVRPSVCAGRWYPADAASLSAEIDGLLAGAAPVPLADQLLALIVPHAGYRFSAPVAAAAYRTLPGRTYRRVIILAFSHRYAGTYRGVDVPRELVAYETPLGRVPIDRDVCNALLRKSVFSSNQRIDRDEHSLELQLPFLQKTLGGFRLVPLLVGGAEGTSSRDFTEAAAALLPWVDEHTLLVASSDFTHYGPNYGYVPFTGDVRRSLEDLADEAAAPLLRCDYDGFIDHLRKTGDTICGRWPICLMLRLLAMRGGAVGIRTAFDTSGNILGDWSNSVTYQSFVFTRRPRRLSDVERTEALRLARDAITAYLNGRQPPAHDDDRLPPALRADGACFVTLQNRGELRGCIGNMVALGPLHEAIIENAISACQDYRFLQNPVTSRELNELHIEISYLTPMQRVSRIDEIVIGRHGLLVALGDRRGVLLPQVAYERGWLREEFLAQTCRKAGLPPDAWKQPACEIYSFEAEVFGEPETPQTNPPVRHETGGQ